MAPLRPGGGPGAPPPVRRPRRSPRRSPHACPARLTDLPRGPAAPRRGRARRPGPPGMGAGRRGGQAGRPRPYVVPVYDYVLVTEPLTSVQRSELGWEPRDAVTDAGNQFHYYRLIGDDRILWGGYDAVYHFGNRVDPALDQRDATQLRLAEHFLTTFSQLEGIRFSHRWGGAIATTTRFTATWGTAHDRRLAWVAGYTGLGVAASRFGARVALDLVDGQETERTALSMVRTPPFPFPPEPLRWAGVELTRRAIARADRRGGRRGPWPSLLDRFGVGFDS